MATPSPHTENSILLECSRDGRPCSITIGFGVLAELRAMVKGPQEVASGSVRGVLDENRIVLEHCSAASANEGVIGLFRTQPAGWPFITEPDCKRLASALPKSHAAVLLIVRTLAQRPWSASLFLVDPRQAENESAALLEFPFDEYLLKNGWLTDLAPPSPPRSMMAPRKGAYGPWVAAGLAAGVLVAAGAAYQSKWRPWVRAAAVADISDLPAAVVPPIGLNATRNLDDMAVSWNRGSDLVRAATSATLIIRNGPVNRMVPVTTEQLREGRVVYHPVSGVDADFRLELRMPDGRVEAESIQVLGFDTSPSLTLPVAALARPKPPEHSADRSESAPVKPRSAPLTGTLTEPKPVKRFSPVLNRDVLEEMRRAHGTVTVSVLVNIDATGKVDRAKIVGATGEPSPSGSYIRLSALNAAKQWRFQPATTGGRPAPSTLTLAFNF